MPPSDVRISGLAVQAAAGESHTCALLESGSVQCWGENMFGQLGLGSTTDVGGTLGSMPSPLVQLGGSAIQVSAGIAHTCVLMDSKALKCWGDARFGEVTTCNDSRGPFLRLTSCEAN